MQALFGKKAVYVHVHNQSCVFMGGRIIFMIAGLRSFLLPRKEHGDEVASEPRPSTNMCA